MAFVEGIEEKEEDPKFKWNPSKKRIQMTNCVAKAYRQLCDQHGKMVAKSFLDVGLSLPTDGSQDHLLSIKGFGHGKPIIGDYTSTDAEIEAYQHAYVKIPKIGENGEYILEDGTPLRQYGLLNNTQLKAALRARGIPGIGNKDKMIKALMADDSTHQPGCLEPDFEEGYIHWDGSQIGSQKQQAFTSNWQVLGYKHQAVDMGDWDEDSDGDEWSNTEEDGM